MERLPGLLSFTWNGLDRGFKQVVICMTPYVKSSIGKVVVYSLMLNSWLNNFPPVCYPDEGLPFPSELFSPRKNFYTTLTKITVEQINVFNLTVLLGNKKARTVAIIHFGDALFIGPINHF